MAQRAPQPGGRHQQLQPDLALELDVAGGGDVAAHGVGDVGVDVERRGAGRPVARALLAADRPPRERRAREPELLGALVGQRQDRLPPAQRVGRRLRGEEREHRQAERLGVPERVPVVALAGEALGADRAALGAGAGLQHVEDREPDGLLQLGVAVDLDVGGGPERRRGTRAARRAGRPSRCSGRRPARRGPGRAARAGCGATTSRRPGT